MGEERKMGQEVVRIPNPFKTPRGTGSLRSRAKKNKYSYRDQKYGANPYAAFRPSKTSIYTTTGAETKDYPHIYKHYPIIPLLLPRAGVLIELHLQQYSYII